MAARPKTGYDKYFEKKMEDPEFRRAFEEAQRERLAIDKLLATLDEHRIQLSLSKSELAERAELRPEVIRRLFSAKGNPTLTTVLKIVLALGCELRIVASDASLTPQPKKRKATLAASEH